MTGRLTHVGEDGAARMVDVSGKDVTRRTATARGAVLMAPETLALVEAGATRKGDVLQVARLAGIMAAKRTGELVPLCHPLGLERVDVTLACDRARSAVDIEATCGLSGRTGVEMEALTAVSVAALAVYDMCKAVDRSMRIAEIRLVRKSGGRSVDFEADAPA